MLMLRKVLTNELTNTMCSIQFTSQLRAINWRVVNGRRWSLSRLETHSPCQKPQLQHAFLLVMLLNKLWEILSTRQIEARERDIYISHMVIMEEGFQKWEINLRANDELELDQMKKESGLSKFGNTCPNSRLFIAISVSIFVLSKHFAFNLSSKATLKHLSCEISSYKQRALSLPYSWHAIFQHTFFKNSSRVVVLFFHSHLLSFITTTTTTTTSLAKVQAKD